MIKNIFLFLAGFGALLSFPNLHATVAAHMDIAVKFDRSAYDLKYDGRSFWYRDSMVTYTIKAKTCNRQKLAKFDKKFQTLLQNYKSAPPAPKTPYDIELIHKTQKISVSRGSALGTWLREVPQKMMYFNAEAQTSCKR